ncbi:MAG: hypothetical protein ACOY37_09650 [Pseudomonadota bacterium]
MIRFAIVLVLLAALPAAAAPRAGGPVQTVGEYTLYFGVLPSAITQGTPHSAGPKDAHGLPRADFNLEHHFLVVVERTRDGVRPRDAVVTVSVPIAGSTVTRTLSPMPINGLMSYGTVFVLPRAARYVFDTTVRIPGRAAPLHARFVYAHQQPRRP